ncbi:MAG: IclR family transcriptional regulator [Actinobacteria bacterium]|nr:IclR family transcriptional regulator [Actinomycetota bacterium]
MKHTVSAVGVIDKSFLVLAAVEQNPVALGELVERTGLSRATAHRLAVALEAHGMLRRTADGRFALGLHLVALARRATEQFPLAEAAAPAMTELRDRTGESVQLYVPDGDLRVCVAALESPHGLRTIVPVGASLPMDRGSAGRVLSGELGRAGWVATVAEREPGVASVSAPVVDADGSVVAAVSVSGPAERLGRAPGRRHGAPVVDAADRISAVIDTAVTT